MKSPTKHQRPLPESQGAAPQGLAPSGQVLPCGKSEPESRPGIWGRSVCLLLRVPPLEVAQLHLEWRLNGEYNPPYDQEDPYFKHSALFSC